MPISNYQTPGVYISQNTTPYPSSVSQNALNVAFFGYTTTVPTNSYQNTFLVSGTGNNTFTLTQSGTISNFVLTSNVTGSTYTASGSGTTVYSGGNYAPPVTSSGVTTFTVSGINANTWVTASYNYSTVSSGVLYTFNDFQSVQTLFGPAFSYINGTPTVTSPCTLAAYLAFSNGAQLVSLMNIASVSGSEADFMSAIQSTQTIEGIDVIVPLKWDTGYNTTNPTTSNLFAPLSNYLTAQANNGIYLRAFIGLGATISQSLINTCSQIATALNNQRVSLVAPNSVYYNPGVNSTTGTVTGNVVIDGFYLAAATAGVFVGQGNVATPITNKFVSGFAGIPNQISTLDSTTLQSYGTTVARQDKYGNIKIRHGLTTNIQNWQTQEISINAIGDQLAKNLYNDLNNSGIIGSPQTVTTYQTLHSIVNSTLTTARNTGLIQAFTNPVFQQSPSLPTAVNVTFQYAPTLPLNYINVTFSVNSSTGEIQF